MRFTTSRQSYYIFDIIIHSSILGGRIFFLERSSRQYLRYGIAWSRPATKCWLNPQLVTIHMTFFSFHPQLHAPISTLYALLVVSREDTFPRHVMALSCGVISSVKRVPYVLSMIGHMTGNRNVGRLSIRWAVRSAKWESRRMGAASKSIIFNIRSVVLILLSHMTCSRCSCEFYWRCGEQLESTSMNGCNGAGIMNIPPPAEPEYPVDFHEDPEVVKLILYDDNINIFDSIISGVQLRSFTDGSSGLVGTFQVTI